MSLEKITHSKSIIASIGIHAFAVASVSLYFYAVKPTSIELTGRNGNGSQLISLSSVSFSSDRTQTINTQKQAPAVEKSRAVVKPDPNAKKVAKTETTTHQDAVTEQASAVSQSGPVGAGTGTGAGGIGSSSLGNGVSDFDGGLLFRKISTFLSTRLDSSLVLDEDVTIKIKLKLSSEGSVVGAELVEGKLAMNNLRKLLAVARNIPLKTYWQSKYTLPGELTIPIFISSSSN